MRRLLILKVPVLSLIFPTLFAVSGCSFARYPMGDVSENPNVIHLDTDSVRKELLLDKATSIVKSKNTRVEFGIDKTFSVKYQHSIVQEDSQVMIPVEFHDGHKYAAFLDTGAPGYAVVGSDVVLDNKLPVWPAFYSEGQSSMGLCHIPELSIGTVRIKDIMAPYEEQQWQFRVFNIPVYKHSAIILGRDFIKSFDYVMFDNIKKEVVFSKEGAFKFDDPELWSSYPFYEDPNAGNTIMVKIPIAGHVLDIAFDSCGGNPGLIFNKSHWQAIENDLKIKKLANTNISTWQGNQWPCRKATVSQISIGENYIKNANVNIDENPEHMSIFSLGYFQDTVVVLDYVNNLFWIKK